MIQLKKSGSSISNSGISLSKITSIDISLLHPFSKSSICKVYIPARPTSTDELSKTFIILPDSDIQVYVYSGPISEPAASRFTRVSIQVKAPSEASNISGLSIISSTIKSDALIHPLFAFITDKVYSPPIATSVFSSSKEPLITPSKDDQTY